IRHVSRFDPSATQVLTRTDGGRLAVASGQKSSSSRSSCSRSFCTQYHFDYEEGARLTTRLHAGSQHHPKHDEDWEGPRLLSRRSFLNRTLGKADAVACVKKLGTRCDIEEDVRATHGGARPSSARPTPT